MEAMTTMLNFNWNEFSLNDPNSIAGALQLLEAFVGPNEMGQVFKRGSWPAIIALKQLNTPEAQAALNHITAAPTTSMARPLPRDIDIVCTKEWLDNWLRQLAVNNKTVRFPTVDWNRYSLKIVSSHCPCSGLPSYVLVKFCDNEFPSSVQTAYLDFSVVYQPEELLEKVGPDKISLYRHNDSNWSLLCAPPEDIDPITLSLVMKLSHWHREGGHDEEKAPSIIRRYHKHMGDICVLTPLSNKSSTYSAPIRNFISKRVAEEKAMSEAKKHQLSLASGTKGKDFFSQHPDKIHYYFVHDEVHEVIARWMLYDRPSYTFFLRDGEEVATDWDKFQHLPYWRQIDNCIEESLVLALERGIVPQRERRLITRDVETEAFFYGLMRICTTIWKGKWSDFARNHYADIMTRYKELTAAHGSYYDFFRKAEADASIVMKQRGYKE